MEYSEFSGSLVGAEHRMDVSRSDNTSFLMETTDKLPRSELKL